MSPELEFLFSIFLGIWVIVGIAACGALVLYIRDKRRGS